MAKQNKPKKKDKIPANVKRYLEKAGIKHDILEHKTVYTAIDAAKTMKKDLNKIAKSLLVKADKDYYLILLPADYNLDENKLKKVIEKGSDKKVKAIKIPGEKMMEKALNLKAGALTAFGNLHKVNVIVDKNLEKAKKAIFSSGSLNHSVEMAVKDFVKMENAVLDSFGIKKKVKMEKNSSKPKTKAKPKKKTTTKTTKKKSTAKKSPKKTTTKKSTVKKTKASSAKKKTATKKKK
ncbi:MAG TPA: YbaK/EbsC family protein [Patescibacteria group bacterium]|nr:YbaK/EbsC family protein [Patescibacteria group bacterium]